MRTRSLFRTLLNIFDEILSEDDQNKITKSPIKDVCWYTKYASANALHKKISFSLRISSVNVTKPAVSCLFGHEILNGKIHFLCSDDNMVTKLLKE